MRGRPVTTFSRGHGDHDVDGTEQIRGDHTNSADPLPAGLGEWNAVVDTSGHVPGMVTNAAQTLRLIADRYAYLFAVNAYQGWPDEPLVDGSPVYDVPADLISATPGADRGMAAASGVRTAQGIA